MRVRSKVVKKGAIYMASIKGRCEPAYNIVVRLGGVTRTAELLGITQSAVSRWLIPATSNGTEGRIPQRYWDDMLKFALKHNIRIDLYDLSGHPRQH